MNDRLKQSSWRPEIGTRASLGLSAPFAAIAAVLIVYPLIRLVDVALFREGDPLSTIVQWISNDANTRVLIHTVVMSGQVVLISVALGSLIAWSIRTARSTVIKLLIGATVLVPMWMGSVIKIYAWTVLLQTYGVINNALVNVGLIADSDRHQFLYTDGAVVVGMVYHMLPYAVLGMLVGFSSLDLGLIDASRSLGASRWRTIRTIIVPLSTPSILASAILVYVMSIGFFLTPIVLGGATAPFSASFIAQDIFVFFDIPSAATSALALLATGAILIGVGFAVVGRERMKKAMG